jgi:hypothetical protein
MECGHETRKAFRSGTDRIVSASWVASTVHLGGSESAVEEITVPPGLRAYDWAEGRRIPTGITVGEIEGQSVFFIAPDTRPSLTPERLAAFRSAIPDPARLIGRYA